MSVEVDQIPCPHCYGLHDAKGVERCCARVNQELDRKGIGITLSPEVIAAAIMFFQSFTAKKKRK